MQNTPLTADAFTPMTLDVDVLATEADTGTMGTLAAGTPVLYAGRVDGRHWFYTPSGANPDQWNLESASAGARFREPGEFHPAVR